MLFRSFYVVSDGGAQPGVFGADSLQIKNASKFFAFHLPNEVRGSNEKEEPKPRTLSISEGKKTQTRPVTEKLTFPSSQRVTVKGLSPSASYELTPRQGAQPALARDRDTHHRADRRHGRGKLVRGMDGGPRAMARRILRARRCGRALRAAVFSFSPHDG